MARVFVVGAWPCWLSCVQQVDFFCQASDLFWNAGASVVFNTPLQRAIARGMRPDGDLADELNALGDYSIQSKKDAKAICKALRVLVRDHISGTSGIPPSFRALISFFQDVDGRDAPAFQVLFEDGLPLLIRTFDAAIQRGFEADVHELLFVLKILAMYGSRAGAEKIIEAVRRPFRPDSYMWHVILSAFSNQHPQRDLVFQTLSDPLPAGFMAVALLDSANQAAMESDLSRHPFDSPAGWKQLQRWLKDPDPDHASYGHSATAALPFMNNPARDQLLALAMDHADARVQMEAAWAAGKLGREGGLKILARFCLDINHSRVAQRYLMELHREDFIPVETADPSFQALADFAEWLAHPNELGRHPDDLEIVDHRVLAWPPDGEARPFWVIRYRLRDQTGLDDDDVDCGLVGSMTWCFFMYKMHLRPPEDVYAIHCYWEMAQAGLLEEIEVAGTSEYAGMLRQWQGGPLESTTITLVVEVSLERSLPARIVALARAKRDGDDGWVVLDGSQSRWYPKSEQPDIDFESVILKIHVGQQLLGFGDEPDRARFLVANGPMRSPQQVIAAYERLLSEASDSPPERQKELLGSGSLLSLHFDNYVAARAAADGVDDSETRIRVYERFLTLAARADESIRRAAYESFSMLGEHFDTYVEGLIDQDRVADVRGLIEMFARHWDHNDGHSKLGSAAFKAGVRDVAEHFLKKLREGLKNRHRGIEMSMLAEILCDRGEPEEARNLLVDCLRKIVIDIRQNKYNSERETMADEYRHHRSTYLRLFPQGDSELMQLGISAEPW